MKDIAAQCKFVGSRPYNDPNWWKKHGKSTANIKEWRDKCVLRRTKENIISPPIYHNIEVKPTRREVRLIEKIRTDAKDKFERWKISNGMTKIKLQGQILSLIQTLRMVSNSYYSGETDIVASKVVRENAKVNVMLETLDRKIWEDPTRSVVIFSQFTSYLGVLEKVIEEQMVGVEVMKFTGRMNSKQRNDIVEEFTTSTVPRVLLVSLMAGGVGLNLMPCATVFLSEPYYNPFLEKQAEERVHRLGQVNQVNVYRFSMDNSVETWINVLKQKKLFLAGGLDLLSPQQESPVGFSFNDLSALFTDLVGFQQIGADNKSGRNDRVNRDMNRDMNRGMNRWNYPSSHPSPPRLESLPSSITGDQTGDQIGIDCSICLEDCGYRNAYNLGCGHLFHQDCLDTWRNINNTCPMCKRCIRIM
jgi:superfamily II DNA or RNA helicase